MNATAAGEIDGTGRSCKSGDAKILKHIKGKKLYLNLSRKKTLCVKKKDTDPQPVSTKSYWHRSMLRFAAGRVELKLDVKQGTSEQRSWIYVKDTVEKKNAGTFPLEKMIRSCGR